LKNSDAGSRPVYSAGSGRICLGCGQLVATCTCREQQKPAARPATEGIVRVSLDIMRRKDKGVTVVNGVALDGQPTTISGR
jgi:translation initiation factor 1